ncbi:hypothetical protein KSB_85910 [Ktedonobacter robiniae]|uniref:Uncharacterized protein n=1 Tax=Ktedonobacter robiniae TaxID=2778365 RepID=A0ABQ3V4K8_9CHLR|nr:hypothetical protein KSB_85910 [Ktedonobacter robiniae]
MQSDGAVPDIGVLLEGGFDLAQFDAIATHLHLPVHSAYKLDLALLIVANEVARPVQTLARLLAPGVRNEALGGLARLLSVPQREAGPSDIEFADRPLWEQVQPIIQHIDFGVGQGMT